MSDERKEIVGAIEPRFPPPTGVAEAMAKADEIIALNPPTLESIPLYKQIGPPLEPPKPEER
jgi:hypothetical protein